MLTKLAPGVHIWDAAQGFFGLAVGTRMTVVELPGGLFVHSPIAVAPEALAELGGVRWVLAPNLFHHLYVGDWVAPGREVWAAPGLDAKRKDVGFTGVVDEVGSPFGDELLLVPLRCFGLSNEVVVLHRPSGTLITTDLVFNLPETAPAMTRFVVRLAGGYPGCQVTLLEKLFMKRELARKEIGHLLSLDFDRLVMAHGNVVEQGGKDAFREAYRWLLAGHSDPEGPEK